VDGSRFVCVQACIRVCVCIRECLCVCMCVRAKERDKKERKAPARAREKEVVRVGVGVCLRGSKRDGEWFCAHVFAFAFGHSAVRCVSESIYHIRSSRHECECLRLQVYLWVCFVYVRARVREYVHNHIYYISHSGVKYVAGLICLFVLQSTPR